MRVLHLFMNLIDLHYMDCVFGAFVISPLTLLIRCVIYCNRFLDWASEFSKTMQHIFTRWLPESNYRLDNRPHFEVLGERYKNNDPNSEEEVWIPIKQKNTKT